jgi:hypothetical protein
VGREVGGAHFAGFLTATAAAGTAVTADPLLFRAPDDTPVGDDGSWQHDGGQPTDG